MFEFRRLPLLLCERRDESPQPLTDDMDDLMDCPRTTTLRPLTLLTTPVGWYSPEGAVCA